MARRGAVATVYLTGLAQGFALVVVPAAAGLLTSPRDYGFSGAQYGGLFVPMVAGAVAASAAGGMLADRWGLKRLFLTGAVLDTVAMGLVASSAAFMGQRAPAYGVLIAAMLALGAGFGSLLTAANSLAPGLFPRHAASALTALHTLLGTGTALAPLVVGAASGRSWWWIPAAVAAAFLALTVGGWAQPLATPSPPHALPSRGARAFWSSVSGPLWGFMAVALLYGICETLCGNWALLFLHGERGLSGRSAALALASFWAMVTLGRLVVAILSVWVPPRWIYRVLPLLLVAALLIVPRAATAAEGVMFFGLAGLACSAFLPLSIGFAERQFTHLAELVAGELMAAYMIGYGIAAFAVGPLVDVTSVRLGGLYGGASLVAAAMAALAYVLTRSRARA
jgi:FHS family glucose/mannose:H+ symporter-like MFS transporter